MFSHFIAVDYSARNRPSPAKPSRDAIWVAEATATGRVRTHYFRTRQACHDYLRRRLIALRNKRVLIGWDFSFGYPKGLAKALRLKSSAPWRAVWDYLAELVEDGADNRNNRFRVGARLNEEMRAPCGPFWGGGRGESGIFLGAKKDFSYPVPTRRALLAERRLVETLHRKLQPAWKLAYAGSVGSQSLLGIPRLLALRDHEKLREASRIWPFEEWQGGGAAGAINNGVTKPHLLLHAEIYPSLLERTGTDKLTDRAQVRAYVKWLQQRQRAGKLLALLDRPWGTDEKAHRRVTQHEGWVLGIQDRTAYASATTTPAKSASRTSPSTKGHPSK